MIKGLETEVRVSTVAIHIIVGRNWGGWIEESIRREKKGESA